MHRAQRTKHASHPYKNKPHKGNPSHRRHWREPETKKEDLIPEHVIGRSISITFSREPPTEENRKLCRFQVTVPKGSNPHTSIFAAARKRILHGLQNDLSVITQHVSNGGVKLEHGASSGEKMVFGPCPSDCTITHEGALLGTTNHVYNSITAMIQEAPLDDEGNAPYVHYVANGEETL